MEKKLTAVQWLIENAKGFHNAESSKAMQEQALRMEREQIEEAYKAALPLDDNPDYMADKYYNSKYGK